MHLIKEGSVYKPDGDSCIKYYLFKRSDLDKDMDRPCVSNMAMAILMNREVPIEGVNLTPSAYDCTGRWFAYEAFTDRITKRKVLVIQTWMKDV